MSAAVMSADRVYRYELTRSLGYGEGRVCWVMFNPSTADAERDDPTLRRVIWFSKRFGFRDLVVVNLIPLRTKDPREALKVLSLPVRGEYFENVRWVEQAIRGADVTIAAWGSMGERECLGDTWRERIAEITDDKAQCLGVTAGGQPRHPLYVPKSQVLVPLAIAEGGTI